MKITQLSSLNEVQIQLVKQLIKECQMFDGTHKEPYLLNTLNFDKRMPSFFLGYEEEKIIGLLYVYADTKDVEVSIFIHPEYRRRGYATDIYQRFLKETEKYKLNTTRFQTEAIFLENNPDFISKRNLNIKDETETWFIRDRYPFTQLIQEKYLVKEATKECSLQIVEFVSEIFSTSLEVSKKYVDEAIASDNSSLYALLIGNTIVSICIVDYSSENNYLYGLAVLKKYQRQGIGSYLVKEIINQMIKENNKRFQIAVEDSNITAKIMYEKLGFVFQTQVVYLNENES